MERKAAHLADTLNSGLLLVSTIDFELCAQAQASCAQAQRGGASRIELCASLEVGGLTPSSDLIIQAVRSTSLPVHILLRPTAEHFLATPAVLTSMIDSMERACDHGAAGFVLGFLNADASVDVQHTRELVERAAPLPVTFHRAFDQAAHLSDALEDVISTGCTRLLTSGGQPDVLAGASQLARLNHQAAGRITIAGGGGLRLHNAAQVARQSQLRSFHASLREVGSSERELPLWLRMQQLIEVLSAPSGTPEALSQAQV